MYYIITLITDLILLVVFMANKKTVDNSNNFNALMVFLVLPLISFVLAAIICLILGIKIKPM